MQIPEEISEKLDLISSACWIWMMGENRAPILQKGGKCISVRRMLWKLSGREITEGRDIRSICGNQKCVRPDHMRLSSGTMLQRLFAHFSINQNGCWVWAGAKCPLGYGFIGNPKKGGSRLVHRLSYELNVGPVPDELWVLHKCDFPSCFNPQHLFIGTPKANSMDMLLKGRGSRILVPSSVKKLREKHRKGIPVQELASEFGLSEQSVRKAAIGQTWKEVI